MEKVDRASAQGVAASKTVEEILDLYHDFQYQYEINKKRADKMLEALGIALEPAIATALPDGTPGDRKIMERDGWEVHATRAKKVSWDSEKLLRHLGTLGPEIVELKPNVRETVYKNLDDPEKLSILDDARVVEVGELKIRIKEMKD